MKAYLVIAAIAAASTPVLVAAADTAAGSEPARQDRQICRRVEALTGSHVSRVRVCHTARQWRAMSDTSVDDAAIAIDTVSQAQGGYENGVTPKGGSPR
jgi:hypothetical protein